MGRGKMANTLDKGCKVWSCQGGRKGERLQRSFIDVMEDMQRVCVTDEDVRDRGR